MSLPKVLQKIINNVGYGQTLTGNDNDIVHKSGNEAVYGYKSFRSSIGLDLHEWHGECPFIWGTTDAISTTSFPTTDKYHGGFITTSSVDSKWVWGFFTWGDPNRFCAGIINAVGKNCNVQLHQFLSTGQVSFHPEASEDDDTYLSGVIDLGMASWKWKDIYASNGTINTSDERLKSTITSVPDEVLDAWENVNFVQYQFNDAVSKKGPAARFHNGLIAQNIDRVFKANNLDASKYGLFCYDEWDAESERKDDNGNIVRGFVPAGNQYSLRYEEALCMEAAYQRRRADRAEARIANLEEEVSSLKSQFSQLLNSAAG